MVFAERPIFLRVLPLEKWKYSQWCDGVIWIENPYNKKEARPLVANGH